MLTSMIKMVGWLVACQVDDAIWAAEKAISKAKSEWQQANQLIELLQLKPQFLTFKAWLWAAATVRILAPFCF